MRFLWRLAVGLAALVVVAIGVGYMLPRDVVVIRSVVLAVPPEGVFPYVNDLRRASEWSPWLAIDPEVRTEYSGPESGVGNRLTWASEHPQVGNGSQQIVESDPPRHVRSVLDFAGMGTAEAWFDLVPFGEGTEVTWGLEADMGNSPVSRWMGLLMERWVGTDYDRGLANLKALLEAG